MFAFELMAEPKPPVDGVEISATFLFHLENLLFHEFGKNPLDGPLGDADLVSQIPDAKSGLQRETEDNVEVIGQK